MRAMVDRTRRGSRLGLALATVTLALMIAPALASATFYSQVWQNWVSEPQLHNTYSGYFSYVKQAGAEAESYGQGCANIYLTNYGFAFSSFYCTGPGQGAFTPALADYGQPGNAVTWNDSYYTQRMWGWVYYWG